MCPSTARRNCCLVAFSGRSRTVSRANTSMTDGGLRLGTGRGRNSLPFRWNRAVAARPLSSAWSWVGFRPRPPHLKRECIGYPQSGGALRGLWVGHEDGQSPGSEGVSAMDKAGEWSPPSQLAARGSLSPSLKTGLDRVRPAAWPAPLPKSMANPAARKILVMPLITPHEHALSQ